MKRSIGDNYQKIIKSKQAIKRQKTKHLAATAKYPQVGFRCFVDRQLVN